MPLSGQNGWVVFAGADVLAFAEKICPKRCDRQSLTRAAARQKLTTGHASPNVVGEGPPRPERSRQIEVLIDSSLNDSRQFGVLTSFPPCIKWRRRRFLSPGWRRVVGRLNPYIWRPMLRPDRTPDEHGKSLCSLATHRYLRCKATCLSFVMFSSLQQILSCERTTCGCRQKRYLYYRLSRCARSFSFSPQTNSRTSPCGIRFN